MYKLYVNNSVWRLVLLWRLASSSTIWKTLGSYYWLVIYGQIGYYYSVFNVSSCLQTNITKVPVKAAVFRIKNINPCDTMSVLLNYYQHGGLASEHEKILNELLVVCFTNIALWQNKKFHSLDDQRITSSSKIWSDLESGGSRGWWGCCIPNQPVDTSCRPAAGQSARRSTILYSLARQKCSRTHYSNLYFLHCPRKDSTWRPQTAIQWTERWSASGNRVGKTELLQQFLTTKKALEQIAETTVLRVRERKGGERRVKERIYSKVYFSK